VATAWGFAATQANPYNDFDGGHKDWNVIFPGVDRPTPTIYWELCREGVDDCRYAATLQEHIGQAKQRGQLAAAQRAERVLAPLLAADAPEISQCAAFGRYRWRMAREILALRGDRPFALPFTAAPDNPPSPIRLGPNLVENPSFEDPPQPDSSPRGRYALGYPNAKEKPAGALTVTDEAAHSGRSSLKWDLSQVAGVESTRRNPRWLTVNVTWPSDTVKRLRGQRVRIGYWMRLGAGTTVPGLQLRQNLKDQPGERFSYSGGVADPAVWNHFETEGRLSPDLESMDIHTWCAIPEPELAKKSYFYMDDVSLQVIEEPPLVISTPVDEYYIGETIPWMVTTTTTNGLLALALLGGDHLIAEQTLPMAATTLRGAFTTGGLKPGFYTLVAKTGGDAGLPPPTIRRQVIVAPDPFNW
jgi:hypothetical protein